MESYNKIDVNIIKNKYKIVDWSHLNLEELMDLLKLL